MSSRSPQESGSVGIGPHFLRDVQALALGREHGFWSHVDGRRILNERYSLDLVDLPEDWAPPPVVTQMEIPQPPDMMGDAE